MASIGGWRHRTRLFVRRFGVDLGRYPQESGEYWMMQAAARTRPDLVLDIGANTGQTGRALRDHGFRGRIVSVEPVSDAYARLSEHAASDPGWLAIRAAVGPTGGEIEIHVSGNDALSSSALPMLGTHTDAVPSSRYIRTEKVAQITLDDLISEYASPGERVFVKLDVQGFEGAVLAGLDMGWNAVVGIRTEMSLVPLYADAPGWRDIVESLAAREFHLAEVLPGFRSPVTGGMLQFDGLFMRAGDGARSHVA